MHSNLTLSDPRDRARSVAATAAIHLALGVTLLTGFALKADRQVDEGLQIFDVTPPPSPPPASLDQPSQAPRERPAPAGRKANPSPIVAPPARLSTPQPVSAAPAAGNGSATTSGAASDGIGPGAAGTGAGRGSGGSGGDGAGRIGARLISGALGRRDYRQIESMGSSRGNAELLLLVSPAGRVERCRTMRSSGNAAVDDLLCRRMMQGAQFQPAREADGSPLYQDVRYFPNWSR
ncbi:MAG: TonB family protein [Sphingomicrobium sp.]